MSNRCIYYVVEIFYDYDSKSYSAVFCDFPDVKSNGKTINEAMDNAENDLHNFIKSMVKEEKQVPFPKSIQSIKKKNKRRKKRKRESLFIPIPVPMNLIDGLGQIHNSTYKRIFGFKEAFKDLIDGFFPKEFVEIVDYDSLERQPDSFISSQFSELRDDLIWRLRTKDNKCYYIYILTEFQRANVYYMAARIDEYVGELRMDLIRSGVVKSNELLPVIFPIVIYNGVTKWTAPLTLDDIQVKADESILSYSKQRYFLIDIHRLIEESIEGRKTIPAIFFRMERAKNFEELMIILKDAYEYLKGEHYNDIRYSLLHWVKAEAIPRYELPIELFKNVNSLEELTDMSYAYASQEDKNYFTQWKKDIELKGYKDGEEDMRLLKDKEIEDVKLLKDKEIESYKKENDALKKSNEESQKIIEESQKNYEESQKNYEESQKNYEESQKTIEALKKRIKFLEESRR